MTRTSFATVASLVLIAGCGCPSAPADGLDGLSARVEGLPETLPEATVELAVPGPEHPVWTKARNRTPVAPPERTRQASVPTQGPGQPATSVRPAVDTPHVVVLIGCTLRRDQLTPHGGPAEASPFLSALSEDGVRFDDAIAAAPWTRVANTALLTGRHALRVGMVEPGPGRNDRILSDELHTLAERFQEAGYLTLGGSANPNLRADFGFAQGFDAYQFGFDDSWATKLSGQDLGDAALGELDSRREAGDSRPLFLQLLFLDPHAPRDLHGAPARPFRAPDVPARISQYDAHVRVFDDAVARLDAGLRARGLTPENTIFLVTADHGEGMSYPEHHGWGHGRFFGTSTTLIPWIVRGPGVAQGHRVLGPVSQVDVLPTLVRLAGLPLPDAEGLDGRDWSAAVAGKTGRVDQDRVYTDTWFAETSRAAVWTSDTVCWLDEPTLPADESQPPFQPGCYDRRRDPLATRPFLVPSLLEDLRHWRAGRADLSPGREAAVEGNLAAQLEALGYAEDGGDGAPDAPRADDETP